MLLMIIYLVHSTLISISNTFGTKLQNNIEKCANLCSQAHTSVGGDFNAEKIQVIKFCMPIQQFCLIKLDNQFHLYILNNNIFV